MKWKLTAVVVCVTILGIAGGQPPSPVDVPPPVNPATPTPPVAGNVPVVDPVPSFPAAGIGSGQASSLPGIEPQSPTPAPAPVPPTFDALVTELLAVRTQKAELDKREKAITEALLKKFAEQKSQLEKLGVVKSLPPPTPVSNLDDIPVPTLDPPMGEKKDVK